MHLASRLSSLSASNTGFIALRTKLGREFLFALSMHYGRGTNPHNRCDPYLGASIWRLPLSSFYPHHQHYLGLHHHNAPEFFLCTSLSNRKHLQSPCNSFPLLYTVLTLIQRLYRSDAYVSEHGRNTPSLQCLHRHKHRWISTGYSRLTLRVSVTKVTTILEVVPLLRPPEGMQHSMRLHLTCTEHSGV